MPEFKAKFTRLPCIHFMSHSIRDKISPLNILSKSEILNVSKSFKCVQLKKNKYLVKAGAFLDHLVFLKKGMLGSHSNLNRDLSSDSLPSLSFTFENNFLFFGSFMQCEAHKYPIIALMDSEILILTRTELEGIYESIPGFVAILRQLAQDELAKQEQKNFLVRIKSSQKRYDYFQRNFPSMASCLPENLKASFLNISETELMRIRRKISVGTTF